VAIKKLIIDDEMRGQDQNVVGISEKLNEVIDGLTIVEGVIRTQLNLLLMLNRRIDLGLFASVDAETKAAIDTECVREFGSSEGVEGEVAGDAAKEAGILTVSEEAALDGPSSDPSGGSPAGEVHDDGNDSEN